MARIRTAAVNTNACTGFGIERPRRKTRFASKLVGTVERIKPPHRGHKRLPRPAWAGAEDPVDAKERAC